MIKAAEFTAGLTALGIALLQPPDAATLAVYHDILGQRTDADEWRRFVRWALDSARWVKFPKLPEIQDALREFRGERPLLVEATEAYERVLSTGIYTPEGGTTWDYRSIKERCGEAAADAFLAAGGNAAFASTYRENDRRERFVAGYSEAVRESPTTKLLPAGAVKALPPAEGPFSREEASDFMRQLRAVAEVEEGRPPAKVLTSEEWDARRKAIKQQGDELLRQLEGR